MNYIIGKLVYLANNFIILENNFIGYKIFVANQNGFELEKYKKLFLYKRVQMQNNTLVEELYGFTSFKEKIFFEKLLSVSGIGPKTAMVILRNNLDVIKQLIFNSDVDGLAKLEGVNRKIAVALVNEISVDEKDIDKSQLTNITSNPNRNYKYEVICALQTLGYKKEMINQTIESSLSEKDFDLHSEDELTDLISRIIKEMSKSIELQNN